MKAIYYHSRRKVPSMGVGMNKAIIFALLFLIGQPLAANSEVPYFREQVSTGQLPPVTQRLPEQPALANFNNKQPGEYGGRIRMLMAKAKDIRMMTVYGYARLIAYDEDLQFKADILESYKVDEGRIFTFKLRKNHRWSDGKPFTSEDFRFYWEDVALNEALSPYGPPQIFRVDHELPKFSVVDEYTVRYEWSQPNPYFIPALAQPSPVYIFRPAHYLKPFHEKHADPEALQAIIEKTKKKNWRKLFLKSSKQYRFDNPDLPVLQPWVNTTQLPAERFIFKRNPYFHRVDPKGRQLPYIDEFEINLSSSSLIPAKVGSGETDLQGRYIRMDDYTFLKAAEKQKNANLKVLLWDTARGAHIALYPNLNTKDPAWRQLMRDVRFRRALSLGINRHEINQVIYFGLANDSTNTVLPGCAFYKEEWRTAWAGFDIKQANTLLDEIGLTEYDSRGIRLLPDGRPLEVLVQSAGESTEETDVLELVTDSWKEMGVQLYTKPSQREVLRNRVFSGEAHMSIWYGLPNGIPTPEMSPGDLAPTRQDHYQWPQWGRYYETGEGDPPDMLPVQQLVSLNEQWSTAIDTQSKLNVWQKMLDIHAEQVFSIGLINQVLQPIVVNPLLRNVPEKAVHNWDPGSYFGIYRPDTFWFAREGN